MANMTDDELLTICRRESEQAESYVVSEIAEDREAAMERYFGKPYGDEQGGRSSVVTRDVLETIEWIMPALLRIFISGDDIVVYNPIGPEDEEYAKQATDLANHVFHKDNNGFLILNTFFKDSLLQKMGVVKSYWDEEKKSRTATWEKIDEDKYVRIVSRAGVEVTAHTRRRADGTKIEDEGELDELYIPEIAALHDITVVETWAKDSVTIMGVPPEEFFMSYDAADPDDAVYLEHRALKTKTQLINDGFDRELVDELPADSSNDPTGERATRMGQASDLDEHADDTMAEITVHESYVYADTDDDGVAEWTRVLWTGDTIIDRDTVDSQPFSIITPIPVPHRAYGLSLADLVMDLNRIRTVIMRQTLDSLYLANNPEREVDVNKIIDMDDFLTTRPGGIKRVEEIGASREISHPFVAQHSFAMLAGLDVMAAKRTGVSDAAMAVDADALSNQTATASNNAMAEKNQRVEMIARIFAETGVKHLFRRILYLLVENQNKPRTIRLRGQWVPMDASAWSSKMDVSVDVGLGYGNRDQQVAHLNNILVWQKEMLGAGGMGMVRPKHIYNTMARIVTSIGFKNADLFLDDPGDEPLQAPQQADPQAALIQAQMQIEQGKAQVSMGNAKLDNETKQENIRLVHHATMQKLEIDGERLDIERERLGIDREKIAAGMNETAAKIRSDEARAAASLEAKANVELLKIKDSPVFNEPLV